MDQAPSSAMRVSQLSVITRKWYRRIVDHGSAYSSVSAILALIFAINLFFDFFDSAYGAFDIPLKVTLLAACIAAGVTALMMGKDLPKWVGIVGVALHCMLTAYFVSANLNFTDAAANMQEMPVMAMYIAWFYPRNRARLVTGLYVLVVVLASLQGPYGDLSGQETVREILRLSFFMVLCTELGASWRQRIDSDAMVDELTGVMSRSGLTHRGEIEIERAQRYGEPLSMALIDLDLFKAVNDTKGHSFGDSVLKTVAAQWQAGIRKHDYVGRLGGDEFVMVLPNTTAASAELLLARLHSEAAHPWSWGVAELRADDTSASILIRADRAMYAQKTAQD